MTTAAVCRVVGGLLVVLISAAVGLGGIQLWRSGPQAWPDVVASELTVRRTSSGMIVMAAILLIAGLATIGKLPWGAHAAGIATIVLVTLSFWANHALFGSIRPAHTVTNVVVAAIILALLWFGSDSRP